MEAAAIYADAHVLTCGSRSAHGTELFLDGKTEEEIARLRNLSPLHRLGEPKDIANVVSFLAGTDGGWVNSQILQANGGFAY